MKTLTTAIELMDNDGVVAKLCADPDYISGITITVDDGSEFWISSREDLNVFYEKARELLDSRHQA